MKFAKLEDLARGMSPAEAQANLRSLVAEPRFAAVVKLAMDNRDNFVRSGCQQSMANAPGAQSHCNGSVYALTLLLDQIRQVAEPPKRKTPQGPPAESQ